MCTTSTTTLYTISTFFLFFVLMSVYFFVVVLLIIFQWNLAACRRTIHYIFNVFYYYKNNDNNKKKTEYLYVCMCIFLFVESQLAGTRWMKKMFLKNTRTQWSGSHIFCFVVVFVYLPVELPKKIILSHFTFKYFYLKT